MSPQQQPDLAAVIAAIDRLTVAVEMVAEGIDEHTREVGVPGEPWTTLNGTADTTGKVAFQSLNVLERIASTLKDLERRPHQGAR